MNKKIIASLTLAGALLIPTGTIFAMGRGAAPVDTRQEVPVLVPESAASEEPVDTARQALEAELNADLSDWKAEETAASQFLFRPAIPTTLTADELEKAKGNLDSILEPDFYVVVLDADGGTASITKNPGKQQYYDNFNKSQKG